MALHYGPWVVTFTDGDTAIHIDVYAGSEEDAVKRAHEEESVLTFQGPVRALARRA